MMCLTGIYSKDKEYFHIFSVKDSSLIIYAFSAIVIGDDFMECEMKQYVVNMASELDIETSECREVILNISYFTCDTIVLQL
jgi:hypothetical protein